ncbi:MAG TPA: polyphenol oxidase family protein [Spirochaetota bacterium]|nr:polyphenol oxidase family protein [Spirochaetota bacterium]
MTLTLQNGIFRIPAPAGVEIGIAAKPANPIDYSAGADRIRREERELLNAQVGVPAWKIRMLNQVHGDEIVEVEAVTAADPHTMADADGMVTALSGVCLVIRTADCVPVFIYDDVRRVLGAVHSGWRGCRLDIAGRLVERMQRRYGSSPDNLAVFILPGIGPGSYTVNDDVASYFPGHVTRKDGLILLDLPGSIRMSLVRRGIWPDRILTAAHCTLEERDLFFSHRAGHSGRNLNFGLMLDNRG